MTRVWQAGEEGGEDVAGCGGIITQAPTDIMHKCACTNARSAHGATGARQSCRWGSFRGLSDPLHVNKICQSGLLEPQDCLFTYLCYQATVCFHIPLHWAGLWNERNRSIGQCANLR